MKIARLMPSTHDNTPASGATLVHRVTLHSRLRWVGIVLFTIAVPAAVVVVTRVILGLSPPGHLVVCLAGLLSSLSAFGTNNDTAVHAMRELDRLRALPAAFRAELRDEQARRPKVLAEIHASPKAALVVPIVAVLVVSWLFHRAGVFG
jgi:hypothetical protein